MHKSIPPCLALAAVLTLAACSSDRPPVRPQPQWHPAIDILFRYGVKPPGPITRAELLKGLHAAFDRDDLNHDGLLEQNEVRAVNERRWARDGSTASPLIDWNHDGYVEFSEFAAVPLSVFDQIDTNGDGVLSRAEIQAAEAAEMGKKTVKTDLRGGQSTGRRRGGEGPRGDGDGDGS